MIQYKNYFKLGIICGGPSLERGISLNSARSIVDHLNFNEFLFSVIYVDSNKNFYHLNINQLYSNTPSDFDFKLNETARQLNINELVGLLKEVDIVFPCIHGKFGEDGELQRLLEENKIPFIGSSSKSCEKMFNKNVSNNILIENGYPVLPSLHIQKEDTKGEIRIETFFKQNQLKRAIIKPSAGGSSIGVFSVESSNQAIEKAQFIFTTKIDDTVIVEKFCEGREFTVMVFENHLQQPVALLPTEIEISYNNHQIFDYRRKYLPTANTRYHTPARFSQNIIDAIRETAEDLFRLFKANDFARFDGWVMGNGLVYFTDFNPISGLEQNSFIFRQSAVAGFTHSNILLHVIKNACLRYDVDYEFKKSENFKNDNHKKKKVCVLFGGETAERQVSLMSGTNVFFKLNHSINYLPEAYFLDKEDNIWRLPYSYLLNHTVEEILSDCKESYDEEKYNHLKFNIEKIKKVLCNTKENCSHSETINIQLPEKITLKDFLNYAKDNDAFVFIALHGGKGEDGTLQSLLNQYELLYNGSDVEGSRIGMDKYLTGKKITDAQLENVRTAIKISFSINDISKDKLEMVKTLWENITEKTHQTGCIIKPQFDGCSSGIIRLESMDDFLIYLDFIEKKVSYIPANSLKGQHTIIELPQGNVNSFLLEEFIETDFLRVHEGSIEHIKKNGWIEMTIGFIEKNNQYHAMNPSITIAESSILSVEEKFQGGTGVNLTPPPAFLVKDEQCKLIKNRIERICEILNLKNYGRIDLFFNIITNEIIIIEANTLPALTPSTVIFHQALAEPIALSPLNFIEEIIKLKLEKLLLEVVK